MRVLLLSAYDAASHRSWHQSLIQGLVDFEWQLLSLPPRHFSWRVRGNPLYWSHQQRDVLEQPYDVVLATSMVDLATLRGLVPALAAIPTVLYFHENQFAYPQGQSKHGVIEAQVVSVYSAMAADCILFNSDYNRISFFQGVTALLDKLPDFVPPNLVAELTHKSQVLPVPVSVCTPSDGGLPTLRCDEPLQLVWNHRWEYDKGPEELLQLTERLIARQLRFTLHVVGQQFRTQPAEFEAVRMLLDKHGSLGCWGYVDEREQYLSLLRDCDVVLSTARHDFQGLSVLEACALGCTPLVPDALVYPEWFGRSFRYGNNDAALATIESWSRLKATGQSLPQTDVSRLYVENLLPVYRTVLHSQSQGNSVS